MECHRGSCSRPELFSDHHPVRPNRARPSLGIEIQPSKELFIFGSQGFWGFWSSGSFCVGPNERWEWICRERRPPLLFRCKSLRPWAGSLCQAGQGAEAKPPLFPWSTCILTAKTPPSFAFSLPTALLLPV